MSKLYKKYVSLKVENSSKIYLFKSGIFYIFLDDDAKLMSSILNLKLTNLNQTIMKCGFPVSKLDKYLQLIKNSKLKVEIVDLDNNINLSPKSYIFNEDIKKFIDSLCNVKTEEFSIKEAYSFIENTVSTAKRFAKEMKN